MKGSDLMKIATQNRLAHYQCELNELSEKVPYMQQQLAAMCPQLTSLASYCQYNNGDRNAMARYRKLMSDYKSLQTQLRKTQARICVLQSNIAKEAQRIRFGTQRATRRGYM